MPNARNLAREIEQKVQQRLIQHGARYLGLVILEHERGSREASGRQYVRYVDGRRILHTASAPGQPLAQDTNALRASMSLAVRHLEVDIGVDDAETAKYARYWELDVNTAERRPMWRPALERLKSESRF